MNGRVYDYRLGRFLSVDPFIQDPGNSQSLNPYSHIMNNPLAGTDPSGYFCGSRTNFVSASCQSGYFAMFPESSVSSRQEVLPAGDNGMDQMTTVPSLNTANLVDQIGSPQAICGI